MATTTYLANPTVTVGGNALTDQATAATLTKTVEALETTAFGSTARSFGAGLENNECVITLFMSYSASETYEYLSSIVGTQTTVIVKPTSAADGATNPGFTLTNCYLESLPVINATMGELSTIDITFTGGVYSADVTP